MWEFIGTLNGYLNRLSPPARVFFVGSVLAAYVLVLAFFHASSTSVPSIVFYLFWVGALAPFTLLILLIMEPFFLSVPQSHAFNEMPHAFNEMLREKFWEHIYGYNLPVPTKEHFDFLISQASEIRAGLQLKEGISQEQVDDVLLTTFASSYSAYLKAMPPLDPSPFSAPYYETAKSLPNLSYEMLNPFGYLDALVRTTPRAQFAKNVIEITAKLDSRKLIYPQDFHGTKKQLVDTYFKNTFLHRLVYSPVPISFPDEPRLEHMWLIANSGHGKTQTLQHLLTYDLQRVIKGEISLVVIEPKDKLIEAISKLSVFQNELKDRVVLIDPALSPPAINLMDKRLSKEMFSFVFGSLLDTGMTANQETLFANCLLLLSKVKDANLMSLYKLLDGEEMFEDHWRALPPLSRRFFERDFNSSGADGYKAHRQQVVKRLNVLSTQYPFSQMFDQTDTAIDLQDAMAGGKVVLVNASIKTLGEMGARLFGRFFLALAADATAKRTGKVKPCFIYLDECDVFCKDDTTISNFLARARQNSVGLILAHRWLDEIGTAQSAFEATCSIVMAGGLRSQDLGFMSRLMSCEPELIDDKNSKGKFGLYVRGQPVVATHVPFGSLTKWPQMTNSEWHAFRGEQARAYGVVPQTPQRRIPLEDASD